MQLIICISYIYVINRNYEYLIAVRASITVFKTRVWFDVQLNECQRQQIKLAQFTRTHGDSLPYKAWPVLTRRNLT